MDEDTPNGTLKRRLLTGSKLGILLSHINSLDQIGKSALYDGIPPVLVHGMNLLMLRCNQRLVLPEYLLFSLRSESLRQKIRNRANIAVNQASINQQSLSAILIDAPPLEEQERIVDVLELAETIREQRRQATEKAKRLILRLFEEMFLQNPECDKWPVVTVGEAGIVQLGRQRSPQFQTGRYTKPYLRVANVFEDRIDITDVLEMDFDANDFRKYRLAYGDILLIEGHGSGQTGRPAMWRDELPECCFQNHLFRFRPALSKSLPDYALGLFLHYFNSGAFLRISTRTSLWKVGMHYAVICSLAASGSVSAFFPGQRPRRFGATYGRGAT
jgi:type I restriction enzyme S subunit